MSSHLIVPMRVDALALKRPLQVVGALADLPSLPWFDGTRDRNAQTPNLASAVQSEPFGEQGLRLAAGVHLHWSLPAGLMRGTSERSGHASVDLGDLHMPAAPNRWLVRRVRPTGQAWLIESDYVWRPQDPRGLGSVPYLPFAAADRPYLRLGRCTPVLGPDTVGQLLAAPDRSPADYLPAVDRPLTVLGRQDPSFAAFYPNCRGVFGCHDDAATADADLEYEVFGWYGGAVVDPLAAFIERERGVGATRLRGLLNRDRLARGEPLLGDAPLGAADHDAALQLRLAQHFGWSVTVGKAPAPPWRTLCHGRIAVAPGAWMSRSQRRIASASRVAVGQAVAEAAAALLSPDAGTGGADPADAAAALRRQARVEDQVAAAELDAVIDPAHPDFGAKLAEARHSAQFSAVRGHAVWRLRPGHGHHTGGAADEVAAIPLPPALAHDLDALNSAQARFDLAQNELQARRQALFADWHALLRSLYVADAGEGFAVEVDALRDHLVQHHLEPFEAMADAVGTITTERGADGRWRHAIGGGADSQAAQLERLRSALTAELARHNQRRPPLAQLHLELGPGPRFWRANDPVVILSGAETRRGTNHADAPARGPLPCVAVEIDPLAQGAGDWAATAGPARVPLRRQDAPPWRPLLLEWEVELQPVANGLNRQTGSAGFSPAGYDPDFVSVNHTLPAGQPDLKRRDDARLERNAHFLAGRSLLNASPLVRLERLLGTPPLGKLLVEAGCDLGRLQGAVALPLGGFNEALLMRRAEPQIRIADPLGFAWQQALADRVRAAVATHPVDSPLPDAPFHPLRSGAMTLERLRLVDSFGQTREWRPHAVHAPLQMQPKDAGDAPDLVRLAPRLSQPARLHLHWLSAAHHAIGVNDHPHTTPVCGWLLPNPFDAAIDVYDADGRMLGSIDREGWRPAPAAPDAPWTFDEIANRHLAAVVKAVRTEKSFDGLLDRLVESLDRIEPLDNGGHQSRALLIGRPVAVLRARLDLQLHGAAPCDLSLPHLRHRLLGAPPSDHGCSRVKFPVRIGEHEQSNDGTVALWLPGAHAHTLGRLVHPQLNHRAPTLELSFADEPVTLTVLLDPRALLHATCGILPTKAIGVPPALWAPALDNIAATFLCAPLLMPPERVALPLPAEPGASWAWLQRLPQGWAEWPETPVVDYTAVVAAFGADAADVWKRALAARVLTPDPLRPGRAVLALDAAARPGAAADERLPEESLHALAQIALTIHPASLDAEFGAAAVVREGWLQLRRSFSSPDTK